MIIRALEQSCEHLDLESTLALLQEYDHLGLPLIGHGVALPHAQIKGLKESVSAVACLRPPLRVGEAAEPVALLVLLLGSPDDSDRHLATLAEIARTLRDDQTRDRLLRSESDLALQNALREILRRS